MAAEHNSVIDALLPPDIARKAEIIGAQKARLEFPRLFVLAVLGGAFIGLGAMFATTVLAGSDGSIPFGISRGLAGLVFSLGLILVIIGGAELFTGNTLMVMALGNGQVRLREVLRAWLIVYIGNFVGAVGTALLVFLAGQHLAGDSSVADAAVGIAIAKTTLPFMRSFFMGVLCNVLVCLAVWLSIGARSTSDKVLAVIFPVSAFVAAGFEHSVANMYLIPVALMIQDWNSELFAGTASIAAQDRALSWPNFFLSLVPVTLGNIFGGGVLVGAIYWFVYLREPHRGTSIPPRS